MDLKKLADQAKKIIKENIYLTIATSTIDGKPWISPLFFAYDENYNLYWISNKDSLHSQLIRKNHRVAIVIFDSSAPEGKGNGVYFDAKAKELQEEFELNKAIEILNNRTKIEEFKIKSIDGIRGQGVWRIYRAIPFKIYKLTEGKFINDQYVDERVEITLK